MEKPPGPPLLSICIPTFNRAAVLDRLLANLEQELSGLSGVEICISDNCSTDGTPQVIAKWKRTLPIKSRRNPTNLGLDINFVKILELARGKFIWYSGDDDVFVKGAVARLRQDIQRPEAASCGAIYINADTKRGPMAAFDFDSFRVFAKGQRGHPPLNASFAGSLCLNAGVAKKVVKEKIYFEDRKVLKRQADSHAMDYFSPAYLFLECVEAAGKFGIEPSCGVEIIADGGVVSYERKYYLDLILTTYPLEMRLLYPWFPDGARNYNFKSFLVGAAMASLRPDLAEAFQVSSRCHLKLLELERRTAKAKMLKVLGKLLALPVLRQVLGACFLVAASVLPLGIKNQPAVPEQQKKNLKIAIGRGRQMLLQVK